MPVLKVIEALKKQNAIGGFIPGLAERDGYAVWGKSQVKHLNKNLHLNRNGENDDVVEVFTPIIQEDSNFVNGFFFSKIVGDSVELHLYRANDYDLYPYGNIDSSKTTAEAITFKLIELNEEVFGLTKFQVNDTNLFKKYYPDVADTFKRTIELKSNSTQPGVNSFAYSHTAVFCQVDLCSARNSNGNNNPDYSTGPGSNTCLYCYNVSIWVYDEFEWPEDPGVPTGSGGGGGGGDTPPPTSNCTSTTSCGQLRSLIVEGREPCGGCGPGPIIVVPIEDEQTNQYGYYYSRMAQLDSFLNINAYALVPCDSLEAVLGAFGQMFQNIGNYQVPASVLSRLDSIKTYVPNFDTSQLFIQNLNDAVGTVVNCDFFPIKIYQLPVNPITGMRYTPSDFLDYFRKNIDQFSIPEVSFEPYNKDGFNDTSKWNSDSSTSLGAIVHIDMAQDGSVLLSGYQNQYSSSTYQSHNFTFSTLVTPLDGYHPVSGNRRFGIYTDVSGGFTFYTMGVDRISKNAFVFGSFIADIFGNSGFESADELWMGMQDSLINFINSNQGSAGNYTRSNYIVRPDYADIKEFLQGQISFQELRNRLCP